MSGAVTLERNVRGDLELVIDTPVPGDASLCDLLRDFAVENEDFILDAAYDDEAGRLRIGPHYSEDEDPDPDEDDGEPLPDDFGLIAIDEPVSTLRLVA